MEVKLRHPGRWWSALIGVIATAVGLGISELVAALFSGVPSLVFAIGDFVIDTVPGWVEKLAISLLGTYDKPVLIAVILLLSAGFGALIGVLAARRFLWGVIGMLVFAVLGVAVGIADPQATWLPTLIVGAIGAAASIFTLWVLLAVLRKSSEGGTGLDRRRFLLYAGGAVVLSIVSAVGAQFVRAGERIDEVRAAIRLPRPVAPAPPPPAAASLEIPGITPLYIPNPNFYRIDTALRVPKINPDDWSLRVAGLVDRPFILSYAELMELPQIEADITLACVSNPIGGHLVGNARWQGVSLKRLLERAGVQPGGTQVFSRSVDGFTAGFPTVTALALEEAMVAVGMNDEPLPAEHGFPARLIVPGLFGYVSATKWLSSIELNDFSSQDGYWIPRGWAKKGPVITQSRIDVPRGSTTIPAGPQPIAGVAWAPTRGIERVEVSIDGGRWREAELAAALDIDCWRQWVYRWDSSPGRHSISVRATDGNDDVQTPVVTPVAPSGATGHHTIDVVVE